MFIRNFKAGYKINVKATMCHIKIVNILLSINYMKFLYSELNMSSEIFNK